MIRNPIPIGFVSLDNIDISPEDFLWLKKSDLISDEQFIDYINIRAGEDGFWDDIFFNLKSGNFNELFIDIKSASGNHSFFRAEILPAQLLTNWANKAENNEEFFQRVSDIWVALDHPEWLQKFLPFVPPEGENVFSKGFENARSIAVKQGISRLYLLSRKT